MKKMLLLSFSMVVLLLSGCVSYPGYDLNNDSQLVAITQFDSKYDFSQPKSFYVPEYLYTIEIVKNDTIAKRVTDKWGILSQLATSLKAAGYSESADSLSADMQVSPLVFETSSTSVYYYYDFWYWNPYYYDPYYYPYMPYYPRPVVSQTRSGWVVFRLIDARAITAKSHVVISGVVRGIAGESHSQGQIQSAIQDCFEQSPLSSRQ